MSFLSRLFRGVKERVQQPNIKFGRYTDSYKSEVQYDAWDVALEKFEKKDYKSSLLDFFTYLRDDLEDNVRFVEENGHITFEIFQGSKQIRGKADENKIKAEVKVAKVETLNIGFMRRIMEENFNLKYSRYALDDQNDIVMLYDSPLIDASPYKNYFALKEISINADKQDDLLLDEFDMLTAVDHGHIRQLSDAEKEAKYQLIQNSVNRVFENIDKGKLDHNQQAGGIAYLLLDLIYKLDYLIKPEGYVMETLERAHREYFANNGNSAQQKNQLLRKELAAVLNRPKEDLYKELYNVTATFGITSPANHDRIVSFIDGELGHMDWYVENDHENVAMAITGYIIGYCLFNYAVPEPDKDFFHLYFQIVESAYFADLDFSTEYTQDDQSLHIKNIKSRIEQLADKHKSQYPKLRPKQKLLKFDTLPDFAKSYLHMIRTLDLTKAS